MVKRLKSYWKKTVVPAIVLTGIFIPLGHQLIMIFTGAGLTLEHRLNYGKWLDKDKIICHGRAGIALLTAGSGIALAGILG